MDMFTNKDLRRLIFPVFVEQFFRMFVGMADTFVVIFSSEVDVSGVSLVTSFNTVLIFLFTALASGGAVIISQYIGSRNKERADASASQLLMIATVISVILAIVIRLFFSALFGMWLHMGVIGVALGMSMDLIFRSMLFVRRYRKQKWTKFQVI